MLSEYVYTSISRCGWGGLISLFVRLCSGSLQTILKQLQQFEETLMKSYVKQMLKALNYLHSQGIASTIPVAVSLL